MPAPVISKREAAVWLAAFLLVATLLVLTGFTSADPDSNIYALLAERLAEGPASEWIVPSWWGLGNGAGLFREHPAGMLIPAAALGSIGIPAEQASYVLGVAYGLASLLLIGWLVARVASPREGRWALVLLQLMPVAFVFRIRANHEYPMLLCLLLALVGLDGVRQSWRWLPVVPLALTAALLIKGVFVVLVLLAGALWLATNPTRATGPRHRLIAAGLLSAVVMALAALLYDVAYRQSTGESFWVWYLQRQLAPLTIATPLDRGSALIGHVMFYLSLVAWHPAPWSLALIAALWRWRHELPATWRGLSASEQRGLIFTLGFAAAAILLLSPSSRFAERYAFSATYAVATAGVVVAVRAWPRLARILTRLDAAVPALPAVVWCALMLLRIIVGPVLPRM